MLKAANGVGLRGKTLALVRAQVCLWVGSKMCVLENAVKANTIQLCKELGLIHGVDKFVCG